MHRACRQRCKRSRGSLQLLLLNVYLPKGDHPKDWRAPTRKLDRQALYFFNPASAVTLLVLIAFVSLFHCARWFLPSPSTLTKEFVERWLIDDIYLALRLGMSLLFFHTSSPAKECRPVAAQLVWSVLRFSLSVLSACDGQRDFHHRLRTGVRSC